MDGRAVEHIFQADEARRRMFAIGSARKAIKCGFCAGGRNRESRSTPRWAACRSRTSVIRRTIEDAVHIGQGCFRILAIAATGKAVHYAFRTGGGDGENRS